MEKNNCTATGCNHGWWKITNLEKEPLEKDITEQDNTAWNSECQSSTCVSHGIDCSAQNKICQVSNDIAYCTSVSSTTTAPSCTCTNWAQDENVPCCAPRIGAMPEHLTRTCNPSGCKAESMCVGIVCPI
jgi:hypothetical protein